MTHPELSITEQVHIEAQDLPERDAVAFQITAHDRLRVQHEISRLMNEARDNGVDAEFRRPHLESSGVWISRGYVKNPRARQ